MHFGVHFVTLFSGTILTDIEVQKISLEKSNVILTYTIVIILAFGMILALHVAQAERFADAILASGLEFNWSAVRVDLFGNPKHDHQRRLDVARKFKASVVRVVFHLSPLIVKY